MAPAEDGAMRKIPDDVRAEEGRALARLGDGGWDPLVQAGPPRGALRRRAGRRRGRGRARLGRAGRVGDGGAVAPQRRAGARTSPRGWRPRSACRSRRRSSAPATGRRSARWRTRSSRSPTCAAVRGRRRRCPSGPCLLVDDVRFSGWTLAMLAGPAAPARRAGGLPARARHGVLSRARPPAARGRRARGRRSSGRARSRAATGAARREQPARAAAPGRRAAARRACPRRSYRAVDRARAAIRRTGTWNVRYAPSENASVRSAARPAATAWLSR